MKKIVLTFGLISGAVSSAMMLITLPFIDRIGFDRSEVIGYTTIVVSSLVVFFGVRSYRDNVAGGEFIYFNLTPDFADKYAAYAMDRAMAAGASAQALEATASQMRQFKEILDQPLMNAAVTFVEPFPIGLAVTLISAAVLRRKGADTVVA